MASASLIAANPLNWKRMSSFLRRPISHATCKSQLVFIRKQENTRPSSFNLKCVFSNLPNNTASSNEFQVAVSRNRILDAILKATEVLQQPAVVAVLMGALLMYDPHSALAASGGRRISSRSSLSSSTRHEHSSGSSNGDVVFVGIAGELEGILPNIGLFLIIWMFMAVVSFAHKRSVMKLQIVLLGTVRSSLQKELNRIAEVADTSTFEGIRYLLKATTSFLLEHPDHWISGYSYVDVKSRCIDNLQKRLELHKLNVENNIKRQTQSFSAERCSRLSDEYVVVTILVAARDVHKLPSINGKENLKEALQKLASTPRSLILDVEVLEHAYPLRTPPQQRASTSNRSSSISASPLPPLHPKSQPAQQQLLQMPTDV